MIATPELKPRSEGYAANIEAEMQILGAILFDPIAIARVSSRLPTEAFTIAAHRKIYAICLKLAAEQKPIDLLSVADRLDAASQLDEVGGKLALTRLLDSIFTSANVDLHAEIVLDRFYRRCMAQFGAELSRMANTPSEPFEACLRGAERAYRELLGLTSNCTQGAEAIGEVIVRVYDDLLKRADGATAEGIPTGFYDLDMLIGGVIPGDLAIVAGRPSMGKTVAMNSIAFSVARQGHGVVLFSLEMSKVQLGRRFISASAGINSQAMRLARLPQQDWDRLTGSVESYMDLPVWLDDVYQGVGEMRVQVQRLQAEGHKISLVCVDYLQLMGGGSNRVEELDHICREFKRMARDLGVSVWVLSQLSRGVESRANKRPMMSDLRESGGIEQSADEIIMLYRDEYYDANSCDRGIAEFIVSKNRNGPTGTIKLLFEPEFSRFRNLARG